MSLPLGHMALGVALYDTCSKRESVFRNWRLALMVGVLANLPDMDVIFGLILRHDAGAFHRGPTHSIVFALLAAVIAANLWKIWPRLPKIDFTVGFCIILSHLLADFYLSTWSVSFFWPLPTHLSLSGRGWGEVAHAAIQIYRDVGLIMACGAIVLCRRLGAAVRLSLELSQKSAPFHPKIAATVPSAYQPRKERSQITGRLT